MTLFITFCLRVALPVLLPWALTVWSLLCGEWRQAALLFCDGVSMPLRLFNAARQPRIMTAAKWRLLHQQAR
jgi:hypothetical protein